MEFKGIAWAGNIYQKFEEMCLEVEEAMYEDTVKYVEKQVQKVGHSVKKFCSAVTEDLLPPSCIYPINLASGDLSLSSYGDIDVIKTKENEDQLISHPNRCYDINSLLVHSKSNAPIRKKAGVQKNPIGIKRISKNSHPSKDRTKPVSGDRIKLNVSSEDQKIMSNLGKESEEVVKDASIPDAPSSSSEKTQSPESVRQSEDNSDSVSPAVENKFDERERLKGDSGSASSCMSNGASANGVSFPMLASTIRSSTHNRGYEGEVVLVADEGIYTKDESSPCGSSAPVAESWDKEILNSDEGGFDMEIIEDYEFAESRRGKLDESCVLVDGDELSTLPQGAKKHMSYKKKIREALSSKLRSGKDKRDKDLGGKYDEVAKEKPAAHDAFESDWELL